MSSPVVPSKKNSTARQTAAAATAASAAAAASAASAATAAASTVTRIIQENKNTAEEVAMPAKGVVSKILCPQNVCHARQISTRIISINRVVILCISFFNKV